MGGPPARGLGKELTTPHSKNKMLQTVQKVRVYVGLYYQYVFLDCIRLDEGGSKLLRNEYISKEA
jgi:hypothetical protein